MRSKYVEVYSTTLANDAVDLSKELYEAMKKDTYPAQVASVLRTQCRWMRFNAIADTLVTLAQQGDLLNGLGQSLHSDIGWSIVNRLLNLPASEYDFNAFGLIHSLSEFKEAMEHCSSSSVNGVWHIGHCAVCNQAFGLEYNMVIEFERRGMSLPRHCADHMGEAYISRVLSFPIRDCFNQFNPILDSRQMIKSRNCTPVLSAS